MVCNGILVSVLVCVCCCGDCCGHCSRPCCNDYSRFSLMRVIAAAAIAVSCQNGVVASVLGYHVDIAHTACFDSIAVIACLMIRIALNNTKNIAATEKL